MPKIINYMSITNKTHHRDKGAFLLRLGSLITVFAIFLSLSLVMNGRWFGHAPDEETTPEAPPVLSIQPDGSAIINTTGPGKDIMGYAGPTPLEITVTDGKVTSIKALPNMDTPNFFDRAANHLFPQWEGKTVADALSVKADACTGATYSAEAIIGNVNLGLQQLDANSSGGLSSLASPLADPAWWCAIAVALCAAILPFFIHNKTYHLIQLALNVGVLGFWTGTFLSYTVLISLTSNALRLSLLPVWILVAIAFLMPLFGKGNRYCTWTCPLGSLQQIAGMPVKHKPHLAHSLVVVLTWVRRCLWGVLVCLLWAGIGTEWIDYELFTAFMVGSAPTVVLWMAGAFVLLSVIIDRPFCRFVCPMGCAIDMAHNDR